MKILSGVVAVLGAISIVLAIVVLLAHIRIMGVTGAGFLRGATALLLLSLAVMVYDKLYIQKNRT